MKALVTVQGWRCGQYGKEVAEEWPINRTPPEIRQRWHDEQAALRADDSFSDDESIATPFLDADQNRIVSHDTSPATPGDADCSNPKTYEDSASTPYAFMDDQLSPLNNIQLPDTSTTASQIHPFDNCDSSISPELNHVQPSKRCNGKVYFDIRPSKKRWVSEIDTGPNQEVYQPCRKRLRTNSEPIMGASSPHHKPGIYTEPYLHFKPDMIVQTITQTEINSAKDQLFSKANHKSRFSDVNKGKRPIALEPCRKRQHSEADTEPDCGVSKPHPEKQRVREASQEKNLKNLDSIPLTSLKSVIHAHTRLSDAKPARTQRLSKASVTAEIGKSKLYVERKLVSPTFQELKQDPDSSKSTLATTTSYGGKNRSISKAAQDGQRHSRNMGLGIIT